MTHTEESVRAHRPAAGERHAYAIVANSHDQVLFINDYAEANLRSASVLYDVGHGLLRNAKDGDRSRAADGQLVLGHGVLALQAHSFAGLLQLPAQRRIEAHVV